ncbi:hypothetical protein F2Q70_00036053 [Brassica cretica]|uniref:Ubiquitin-like protease family profile domain-containing protein n=1 Tax=Brassica cretica TaxID=69181 RepID=A0A8S9GAQ2_BRACR|nr:hypothetical protein F2Q68_00031262 [Brassica cretica]KAF2584265.1 hypothetical protein F2Q70_00036053 [Brassica cretica]
MHGLMSYRRFGRARSLRNDRTLVRARSLRSDRANARARSLRSDRAEWTFGRYVAIELWLELCRYSKSVNGDKGGRENNVHAANTEPGCLTEPSVVIMDKTKPTKSDLEREEERREAKTYIVKEYCRAKSEREMKLAASQQSLFLRNSTAKQIVPTKNVGHGYNPFAPVDKKNAEVLLYFLKEDPHHTLRFKKKPSGSRSLWFATLRTPLKWLMGSISLLNTTRTRRLQEDFWKTSGRLLEDFRKSSGRLLMLRYSEHPEHFRSDRLCFFDSTFGLMWIDKYGDFKSSEPGINGLGRRFPPGAFDHYAGLVPKYRQSNHIWEKDVDDIYAPVNYNNEWVSIPKKHITIWDNIPSHIKPSQLAELIESFTTMIPYLLVELAPTNE